jgi:hypothetical protein
MRQRERAEADQVALQVIAMLPAVGRGPYVGRAEIHGVEDAGERRERRIDAVVGQQQLTDAPGCEIKAQNAIAIGAEIIAPVAAQQDPRAVPGQVIDALRPDRRIADEDDGIAFGGQGIEVAAGMGTHHAAAIVVDEDADLLAQRRAAGDDGADAGSRIARCQPEADIGGQATPHPHPVGSDHRPRAAEEAHAAGRGGKSARWATWPAASLSRTMPAVASPRSRKPRAAASVAGQ